jgi:hypothetical protein
VSISLVEQNINEALLTGRAYVQENGHIVMQGSGEELLPRRPLPPVRSKLMWWLNVANKTKRVVPSIALVSPSFS